MKKGLITFTLAFGFFISLFISSKTVALATVGNACLCPYNGVTCSQPPATSPNKCDEGETCVCVKPPLSVQREYCTGTCQKESRPPPSSECTCAFGWAAGCLSGRANDKCQSSEVCVCEGPDAQSAISGTCPGLCVKPASPTPSTEIKDICVDVKPDDSKKACEKCFTTDKGTWTALGCIPTNDLNEFIGWLLGRVIFIATGIAFILLVVGAFQILTSAGNPEKVKAGGELITSTIAGLLLIILSVFLLKLIGVDILHIPGF